MCCCLFYSREMMGDYLLRQKWDNLIILGCVQIRYLQTTLGFGGIERETGISDFQGNGDNGISLREFWSNKKNR